MTPAVKNLMFFGLSGFLLHSNVVEIGDQVNFKVTKGVTLSVNGFLPLYVTL